MYLREQIADAALDQLEQEKDAIHGEIGGELTWNPNPEKQDKIVMLDRPADLSERGRWDEYIDWMTKTILSFRSAFRERVKNLAFSEMTEDADD